MRCLKIPRRYLIYCFGFLLSLFFTFSFCSSSSFAVEPFCSFEKSFNLPSSSSYPFSFQIRFPSDCSGSYLSFTRLSSSYPVHFLNFYGNSISDFDNFSFNSYFSSSSFVLPSSFDFSGFVLQGSAYCRDSSGCSGSVSYRIDVYDSSPSGSVPSGSITLTENGTYDVTQYAEAVVDVPAVPGDYHDDLVGIKQAIFIGAATLLVIYFFYCIYRMIIKSAGSV